MRFVLVLVLVLVLAPLARAQTPPDAGVDAPAADAAPTDAGPQFEPPQAIGSTDVAAPPGAPAITAPIAVTVSLRVDKTGAVESVTLVTPAQPPPANVFDDAVIAAAKLFTFKPATFGGKPVKVDITFTHTFEPPPPPPPTPPPDQGPPRTAALRGKLVEMGTRAPVGSATVTVEVGGRTYTAEGDDKGHFRIELPPGTANISVFAPAHNPFIQKETLSDKQELGVTYYVERDRYDPYEITVVGEERREEVSRITLRGPELQQVPGTFGDPFRVIQALPGVASVVSLLPFPVIRGSSPSSTGFLIDGTRVPLLFHLLSGPSVIHPEFIDEIQFYPGGAPASYGGYTGGIVDGRTARAANDAHLIDVDANLLQAGGLVREPVKAIDATVTAAARYGYPGLILSLATDQASLSYWDYQLRADGGTKANGWTVFAFGANDELDTPAPGSDPSKPNPPLAPALILRFHRLDVRYHQTIGDLETTYRVVGGYDHTFSQGTDFTIWSADPQIRSRYKVNKELVLAAGLDGDGRSLTHGAGTNAAGGVFASLTAGLSTQYVGSAFAEAIWRPTPDWMIRPGVRGDVYHDPSATKPDVDPRLTVRYKLGHRTLRDVAPDSDDSAIWLKASTGIYHQPPRFVLPLPGLDQMPLKYGLLRAYQTSFGAEIPLEHRFELSTEAYFNYMDPTIFDLSINAATLGTGAQSTLLPTQVTTTQDMGEMFLQRLTKPQLGRAYGLEILLRRQAKSGIFGWISYTLSRAERERDGSWGPYDFDRTHLLNLVMGLPLRRNWDVGIRMQYQSGLPATTTSGYNTARADGYVRFDVRVDKRAVYRNWLLDFYVDITNVALLPEEVTPGNTIRYVLPTVGFRGRF
jgi:TonB family protein